MVGHCGGVKFFTVEIPTIKAITASNSHVLTYIKSFTVCKFNAINRCSTACNKGYCINSSFPYGVKRGFFILIPSLNAVSVCIGVHYAVFVSVSKEFVSISCIWHIKGEVLPVRCRALRCRNSISTVKNSRTTCNAYGSGTCGSRAECSRSNVISFACGDVVNDEEVDPVGSVIVILGKCNHLGVVKHTKSIVGTRAGNRNIAGYERYEHKHLLIFSVKSNVCVTVYLNSGRILNLYPFCIEGCVTRYNSSKVIERACAVLIRIPTCKDIAISCRYGRIFKCCCRSYRLACNHAFCSVKVEGYNTACFFITVKP